MRIVLDTNVWVSALLFPGGACDELLMQLLRHPEVELVASPFIIQEFQEVMRVKLRYSSVEAEKMLAVMRRMVVFVDPPESVHVVREKEADNRILECAVAGHADLLVTGDTKHLLPLKRFRGIPIRSPREVLDHWF